MSTELDATDTAPEAGTALTTQPAEPGTPAPTMPASGFLLGGYTPQKKAEPLPDPSEVELGSIYRDSVGQLWRRGVEFATTEPHGILGTTRRQKVPAWKRAVEATPAERAKTFRTMYLYLGGSAVVAAAGVTTFYLHMLPSPAMAAVIVVSGLGFLLAAQRTDELQNQYVSGSPTTKD